MPSHAPSAEHRTRPPLAADVTVFGRPLHRISVDHFHELAEQGAFDRGRFELIRGWIFEITTPAPPHSKCVQRVMRILNEMFKHPEWYVGIQDSISLSDSEPSPDAFVAVGPDDRYDNRLPGADDLALVVEVSHTTLKFDRVTKYELYASEGIPQYWILDVTGRKIEVHTQPHGGKKPGYRKKAVFKPLDELPVIVGGKHIGKVKASRLLP